MRHGQPVTGLVVKRVPVNQHHIVMGPIPDDVMQSHMPGVKNAVPRQLHLLPLGEGANHLDTFGLMGVAIRQTPAKYLGEGLLPRA